MSSVSGKKLVIACGGTGGHLFPGIAVAESWRKRGGEVILLISEKQIDTLATEGYEHLRFERLSSIAMPGLVSVKMPGFLVGFLKGYLRCRKLIREFGADAVLGMGGFTSTGPLMAGRFRKLPTFVHESNAIPGRANRLNANFADAVLVGFDVAADRFHAGSKVETVGTPLRPKVAAKPSREDAIEFFGLDPHKKTIMVMGGSQGARRLNQLVAASVPAVEEAGLQLLHLSGPTDFDEVKPAYDANPKAGVVKDFCSEVQFAYAAADLAVCRSGASCLTELAFYETPSVLIPYPFAADNHQTANAEIFSKPGAAELWEQGTLSEDSFSRDLIALAKDDERLSQMKEKMAELAIPEASEKVCDVVASALN